jgi:osmotically-inducible protein OsmY
MKHPMQSLWPASFLLIPLFLALSSVGYSQIETKDLQTRVRSHIADYYTEDVTVRADKDGIITVEGEADNLFDKLKTSEIISEVKGVRGIVNNMSVHNELTVDAEIQSNIVHELERNDAIMEPEKIKVDVKNGVVQLTGTVSFFREKLLAQSIASWQDGVSDMISNIKVLSPAVARSDENLKGIIADVFERFFPLETHVVYSVHNGEVQLGGTVRDLWAKRHIEEEIQRLIGVHNVVNALEVEKYEQ